MLKVLVALVLIIGLAWYVLSKLYADKIGEVAEQEYESICERKDEENVQSVQKHE